MGGKHLKRLRAEKSKVQLKKKKLSKGQNLTKTTFTVKKILPIKQLQKVEKDEPVSNWNVSLKYLMSRLSHYNVTSKINSLLGIKELLVKHPEILKGSLVKTLITRLLEVLTDEERKIRMTALDLLAFLFELMSSSSFTALHEILNLYLGCVMTHRNKAVQQDSLKLIDILIKYSPEAIKWNFRTVIQNFLRILKGYLYESHAGVFLSGKSKQDLEKGKRDMLFSFYQFLAAVCTNVTQQSLCENKEKNINVNILENEKICLRDLSVHYKRIPALSVFENSENKQSLLSNFNSDDFTSLCSHVIPLVFDVWSEFFPNEKHDEFSLECELSEGVGELLSVLLQILLVLYELAGTMQDAKLENWFVSNYSLAFKKAFTLNFPYLSSVSAQKLQKCAKFCEFEKESFKGYLAQNLIICYLSYSLKIVPKDSILENKIENYVVGALKMNHTEENKILLKVIEAGIYGSQQCEKSNIILHKALEAYHATGYSEFQRNLSKILMKVVLEGSNSMIQKDEGLKNWIKSLPHRLCESQVFVEELETILRLINTSKGEDMLREIELRAQDILENVKHVKLEGISDLKGHKMIADILYRCSRPVLLELMNKNIFGKGMYNQDLENYIIDIFSQKLNNK